MPRLKPEKHTSNRTSYTGPTVENKCSRNSSPMSLGKLQMKISKSPAGGPQQLTFNGGPIIFRPFIWTALYCSPLLAMITLILNGHSREINDQKHSEAIKIYQNTWCAVTIELTTRIARLYFRTQFLFRVVPHSHTFLFLARELLSIYRTTILRGRTSSVRYNRRVCVALAVWRGNVVSGWFLLTRKVLWVVPH